MDRGARLFLTVPLPPSLLSVLQRQGVEVVCPFDCHFRRDELADFLAPLPGFFHLPRNMPVYVPLLAACLEKFRPAAALHVPPEDPREYLAVYEAWRSRIGPGFRVHSISAHPGQAAAEKLRQLKQFCAGIGVDWRDVGREDPDGRIPAWREWERSAWLSSPLEPMVVYRHCLQAGLAGRAPDPAGIAPAAPSPEQGTTGGKSVESVILLGDWLLGDEVFRFLFRHGRRVILVQKAYDVLQWAGPSGAEDAWPDQFCFQPPESRNLRYREEARARGASRAIGVCATFSPRQLGTLRMMETIGLPSLSIETEWPGFLTESDKIRLENFLH